MTYLMPIFHTAIALVLVVGLIRTIGLRSLSKMSGFDFVSTVATGSILATMITASGGSIEIAGIGLAALFGLQWLLAQARQKFTIVRRTMDNAPLLLMRDGRFLEANMRRAQVTHVDIRGKLRAANVLSLDQVRAVVMETTGDISVMHGDPACRISPDLLQDVDEGAL